MDELLEWMDYIEMYVGSLYNKKYIADPAKLPITGSEGVGNL